MNLKPLENEQEYDAMLAWIDEQFDFRPTTSNGEHERLQAALLLVRAYEDEYYPISR